ncbi:hypothetical protein V1L54_24875 [Streptomyces sp. TRM 70361]|uniref:hypothetical protein n=1 Tax=Streptomyces sp. TRM 70361 TaxID=3116553 RepID=UPI002E7B46DC|nr:hypothetical protein [Streptomyces sp. TRM 70361]MEE1942598.1 hypothetical protein [Streptomyces sp. TRM 70361]
MPMPYGCRGALVISAEELRVLEGALAFALRSAGAPAPHAPRPGAVRPEAAREYRRLAGALAEAAREARRLRAFLLADLDRHRAALPGAVAGYLALLEEALALDCVPRRADLEALRGLCAEPAGAAEEERRAGLLRRCERAVAARSARARPASVPRPSAPPRRSLPV